MKSHTRLLTVLDRMDNGPVMEEKDFDKLIEMCYNISGSNGPRRITRY